MAIRIARARPHDAARLAEIHMASFASNAMLLAMYPTPAVRDALQHNLADLFRTVAEDDKYAMSFPVAVDCAHDTIVAYAMVQRPQATHDADVWSWWQWPEGSRSQVIAEWYRLTAIGSTEALAGSPAFWLYYIATDPAYRGRGIGTALMRHVMDTAGQQTMPVYLESTLEMVCYYSRLGFRDAAQMRMALEGEEYEEHGMVWRP